MQDVTQYHHNVVIPAVDAEQRAEATSICFHISAFGFTSPCTMKPPPFEDPALELLDEILKDGFVTSGDPLVCCQPVELVNGEEGLACPWTQPGQRSLQPFSLGYVKGMARITTFLATLHHCWKSGFNSLTATQSYTARRCVSGLSTVLLVQNAKLR